jgi:hypothetical protein
VALQQAAAKALESDEVIDKLYILSAMRGEGVVSRTDFPEPLKNR